MPERTSGVFSVLSKPAAYSLLQRLLGGPSSRTRFVRDHLRPRPGDRILDIGCGPGDLVDHLPGVRYLGIDRNPAYIESARDRYGDRAEFHCMDAREVTFPERSFDLVSALGLLHHLDDDGVNSVFRLAARVLIEPGRLVSVDNALREGQSRIARWLIERDRGVSVRTMDQYASLAAPFFEVVRPVTREDLLRVPYTHAILECRGPRPGAD